MKKVSKISIIAVIALFCITSINVSAFSDISDRKKLPVVNKEAMQSPEHNKNLPSKFILVDGDENERGASGTHTISTKVGPSRYMSERYIGIHPDTRIQRKASSYTFATNESISYNVSAGIGFGPFNVSISPVRSYGTYSIPADYNRYSTVGMKPSFEVDEYIVNTYMNATNKLVSSRREYVHVKSREFMYPVYK